MGKSNVSKALFALFLVLLFALAACSGGSDGSEDKSDSGEGTEEGSDDGGKAEASEDKLYSIEDFSATVSNDGEPIDGGSITFGLVSDTAFEGTLNWNFYDGNPDAQVLQWFDEGLLTYDENYTMTNDGAATYEVSDDNRTFTFTIRDGVNWHDGEPVTAEDWAFAHEVIGHPDYNGPRYKASFRNIEGMEAYHNGEADSISGIEVVDEKH